MRSFIEGIIGTGRFKLEDMETRIRAFSAGGTAVMYGYLYHIYMKFNRT
ncbi:MAG: hypothetical protein II008_03910 [Oscillospiraceae bacterium]|nr:hypothetical protein [Oscillospiraceae bacterium]